MFASSSSSFLWPLPSDCASACKKAHHPKGESAVDKDSHEGDDDEEESEDDWEEVEGKASFFVFITV